MADHARTDTTLAGRLHLVTFDLGTGARITRSPEFVGRRGSGCIWRLLRLETSLKRFSKHHTIWATDRRPTVGEGVLG